MSGTVLLASCDNLIEPDGVPCPGRLRYRWGMIQAACDTCGGWCGIAVADWLSVVADTTAGEAETLPPVGLRPRWLADEMRAAEIAAAVGRYEAAGRDVPAEWRDELAALLTRAARSGGAQDERLRARVEALAKALVVEAKKLAQGTEPEHSLAYASIADRLRRALAGPDDARQDGVG